MKNLKMALTVLLTVVTSLTIFAGPNKVVDANVEKNLIEGLKSQNLGLVTNSAYLLGEVGTSKSVIALMKVLKDGETEEERISAALALTKINTEKAMYAVKQRAVYDDSERVRRCCSMLYQQNLVSN
jgi:HEAT repeat protein